MKFTVKMNGVQLSQHATLGEAWDIAWAEKVAAGGEWQMDQGSRMVNESVRFVNGENNITVERL